MEEKLNFSLPENKSKGSVAVTISIILLLIILVLTAANLVVRLRNVTGKTSITPTTLSAEQTKQLATKLSERNLYDAAAKVWQEYIITASPDKSERAKAFFQIGTLLEKAGKYEDAIENYYRSEMTEKLDELSSQINTHIKDCFEKLGTFSAMRYEIMDRTSIKNAEPAGGKVLAEIGPEKITEADLDAKIEDSINNQLSQVSAFMTAEQLNEQKKKMLEQFQKPQAKQQVLQSMLMQEILYRQGLEEQLSEKPQIKKMIGDVSREIIAHQQMNNQLASKINITDSDLQTYYTANKNQYVEPARAKISHILVADQQQAKDVIERVKKGEDFGKLVKELSLDDKTKNDNGQISEEAVKGSYVPVIGDVNGLNEKIFEANAPAVLEEPFKTEKGWEVIKVDSKTQERQKSFDEARQQVISALLEEKRRDVQQDYIKGLMDKYKVVIHTSAIDSNDAAKK